MRRDDETSVDNASEVENETYIYKSTVRVR